VFWHHRLAHAAGQNYSDHIRQAVLADFWTQDLDQLRAKPVGEDMWDDWSEAVQRAP
jgi:ectoine hydroxylase-related dioxygenase (phytanoyl-CoA dioxygenase family)